MRTLRVRIEITIVGGLSDERGGAASRVGWCTQQSTVRGRSTALSQCSSQ